MQKPTFSNHEIYHLYNRGVEKRLIFGDDKDRFRFIHNLYEMNDSKPVLNNKYWLTKTNSYMEVELPYKRDELIEILAYCLMPNHYHLLVRQIKDKGIVKFMQKLGTAYTNYFNLKNSRVGPLFQGRFKAVLVQQDSHLRHLYNYIHLNPLDTIELNWRNNKLKDIKKSLKFLNTYRWSSYQDYAGIKNFPSIINMRLGQEIIGNNDNYSNDMEEWLKDMQKNQADISNIILE